MPAPTPGPSGRTWPGLPPVGRRGPGHRHHRPQRQGAGRARAEGAAAGRCSPGRSSPPPATSTRRRRSPPPSIVPNAPRCRSPSWKTPPPCGSRWPPAPAPSPASWRPGRPSGASGRCSTTRSATLWSRATSRPIRSTASSGPLLPSPRALTAGSWSAPLRPGSFLAAVRGLSGRGQHLEAFYACLYYAALRPSEAVMLRESDLHLPKEGGRIVLAASASRAGTPWTDHGTARQERGRLMPRTSGSPTPSAPRTPGKSLVRRATATACRHPEMPGQRPRSRADGQRNRSHRPRPWLFGPPSVAFTAPESGAHGRIADGGGPKSQPRNA